MHRATRGPGPGEGRGRVRRPIALPVAVFEESAEAANHLIRTPGVLLVVDGYNVSMAAWPDVELVAQRHRLVAALAELSMRTGAAVHVVFDGAEDEDLPAPPSPARSAVRVTFSSPGVDADEVVIDLVDSQAGDRPVVVATSDRRVQGEVRRLGANVITAPQALGLIGRRPGPIGHTRPA